MSLALGITGANAQLADLQQRTDRLEAGVRNAESIRAVKRLQNAYGHYAELGLWNDFADLFAEDGVGYYPAGKLGKEAIRKLFFQDVGRGKLGLDEGRLYPHIMLQPVVTLGPDGKSAKGRWRVLAMLGSFGGNATWAGGVYENEYIQENGVWKISDLHYYSKFSGAYGADGWKDAGVAIPIHYDAARAGTPTSDIVSQTGPASSLAALDARFAGLAQRVERLNDEAEVTNLQHIYGYYVDRKLWDQVADLFAGDATMELGQQGVYAGKDSIRRALDQFGPQGLREGEVNDHLQLQTIVHVAPDGRTAKARGVELIMSGAQLGQGIVENEFIKQDGVWKIKSLHYYPRLITDYDKGWAKDAKPAPGPSRDFPPDRPPTEVYEIYPKFYMIPFHFPNPVTAPQSPPVVLPAIRTIAELEERLAEAERKIEMAKAYDAAENLASAYGYGADGASDVHQITQPVIHVAADGRNAKIRVRLLQIGGPSGGNGAWTAGVYENETVKEDTGWKLKTMNLYRTWTASYREGWARATILKINEAPSHYKNPVTGRAPAVLLQ